MEPHPAMINDQVCTLSHRNASHITVMFNDTAFSLVFSLTSPHKNVSVISKCTDFALIREENSGWLPPVPRDMLLCYCHSVCFVSLGQYGASCWMSIMHSTLLELVTNCLMQNIDLGGILEVHRKTPNKPLFVPESLNDKIVILLTHCHPVLSLSRPSSIANYLLQWLPLLRFRAFQMHNAGRDHPSTSWQPIDILWLPWSRHSNPYHYEHIEATWFSSWSALSIDYDLLWNFISHLHAYNDRNH